MAYIVLLLLLHIIIVFPRYAEVAVLALIQLLVKLPCSGDFKLKLALDVCDTNLLWGAVHIVALSHFTDYLLRRLVATFAGSALKLRDGNEA